MKPRAASRRLPASDDPSVTSPASPEQRWQVLFGSPAPARSSIIAQAIAWQEQVAAEGDVAPHILRDLRILAHQVSEARRHLGSGKQGVAALNAFRAPCTNSDSSNSSAMHDLASAPREPIRDTLPPVTLLPASSQLAAGNRLVKHYGGETHVVEVTPDGMIYRDQTYASLSAVAKVITGTHWNGLLFFGLRRRKTYPRKAHG